MKRDAAPSVKSLDRGLDILEHVASARNPPSFSHLLAELEIPRSSLFHLLNNLLSRHFLERDSQTDGYRLGPKLARLAKTAPRPPLAVRVLPFLQQLSAELNETCGFYVRAGDAVEVVASAISTQALSYTMKAGMRASLYAVSAGKIVLAEFDTEEMKQYLDRVALTPITAHTVRSRNRLKQEIQSVKSSGFAYSREEFTPGISAVATAVWHDGAVLGALNVAVPTVRFTPDREATFREALRIAARTIADALS